MESKESPPKKYVQTKIEGSGGSHHSYSEDELRIFTNLINYVLEGDEHCKKWIPMDSISTKLFEAVGDGILLCKLINKAAPHTIDVRAINTRYPLNIFQIKENLNLAIQSAKAIGCKVISIFPETIMERREHMILGLIWQILKIKVLSMLNLKEHAFLIRLLKEGEELTVFKKLPPEEILLRWFNYHLTNAKHERKITNFGEDVKDGICFTILLNQLNPTICDKSPLKLDETERCEKVTEFAKLLGVKTILKGRDIQIGNSKINLIFSSMVFNHCPGLIDTDDDFKAAKILREEPDPHDTLEERSFRMWVNSLNLENVAMDLYEDSRDGILLLKVLDKILPPGHVDWKRVSLKPDNKFKKVANCNYACEVAKNASFKLVNVGGVDIHNASKKSILAIIWQLIRKHTFDTLGGTNEEKLLEWANSRVPESVRVTSFKDPHLKTCKFFFELLRSIEPKAIDLQFITEGSTPEEIESNAKYVISVARRIGATTYLVWEHIRDVKSNLLLVFVASVKAAADCKVNHEGAKELSG